MWELIKEIAGDVILIGYGLFFLWVFLWIRIFGSMTIVEPNSIMGWVEVIGAALFIVLGIVNLRKHMKKRRE